MSKTESIQNYEILDGDDDVLLFSDNNTFTVRKFKELVGNEFWGKLLQGDRLKGRGDIKSDLSSVSFGSGSFICGEIQWKSIKTISCKLLKIGSKGWQEGQLKVQARATNSYYENEELRKDKYKAGTLDISVEFCLDRPPEMPTPPEPESPLDKIRQSVEYKNL